VSSCSNKAHIARLLAPHTHPYCDHNDQLHAAVSLPLENQKFGNHWFSPSQCVSCHEPSVNVVEMEVKHFLLKYCGIKVEILSKVQVPLQALDKMYYFFLPLLICIEMAY